MTLTQHLFYCVVVSSIGALTFLVCLSTPGNHPDHRRKDIRAFEAFAAAWLFFAVAWLVSLTLAKWASDLRQIAEIRRETAAAPQYRSIYADEAERTRTPPVQQAVERPKVAEVKAEIESDWETVIYQPTNIPVTADRDGVSIGPIPMMQVASPFVVPMPVQQVVVVQPMQCSVVVQPRPVAITRPQFFVTPRRRGIFDR